MEKMSICSWLHVDFKWLKTENIYYVQLLWIVYFYRDSEYLNSLTVKDKKTESYVCAPRAWDLLGGQSNDT